MLQDPTITSSIKNDNELHHSSSSNSLFTSINNNNDDKHDITGEQYSFNCLTIGNNMNVAGSARRGIFSFGDVDSTEIFDPIGNYDPLKFITDNENHHQPHDDMKSTESVSIDNGNSLVVNDDNPAKTFMQKLLALQHQQSQQFIGTELKVNLDPISSSASSSSLENIILENDDGMNSCSQQSISNSSSSCNASIAFSSISPDGDLDIAIDFDDMLMATPSTSSASSVIDNNNRLPLHNRNYQEARYKTELCLHYRERNFCPHGQRCLFAHGLEELRPYRGRHPKHKTQRCKAFHEHGFCNYGYRCSYIHSESPRTIEYIKKLNHRAQIVKRNRMNLQIRNMRKQPSNQHLQQDNHYNNNHHHHHRHNHHHHHHQHQQSQRQEQHQNQSVNHRLDGSLLSDDWSRSSNASSFLQ
ncbi:uncharacterized protein LOC124493136 [Dermatophagoides farinae]